MSDPASGASVPATPAPATSSPSDVKAAVQVTFDDLLKLFAVVKADAKAEAPSLLSGAGNEMKSVGAWVVRTVKRWHLPALWGVSGSSLLMQFPSLLKLIGL